MAVSKGARKIGMVCMNGPWEGQTLWLWTKSTMWMNINGTVGRYFNGYWENKNENNGQPSTVARTAGNREDNNTTQ